MVGAAEEVGAAVGAGAGDGAVVRVGAAAGAVVGVAGAGAGVAQAFSRSGVGMTTASLRKVRRVSGVGSREG